jgi:ABC-type phosphate transport system substrate-binding protein
LNKTKKILLSVIVLAIFAFSVAPTISLAHASATSIAAGTLNIAGSSTVYPIAYEEASQFPAYWNALVAANPSWDAYPVSTINIQGEGSGTAIPNLVSGAADIGEMSRPPQANSAEWGNTAMANMQIWAVGIDSVAIVLSPDMTWFPTDLTTLQVAELFADTPASSYTTPYFSTWNDFLTAYYAPNPIPATINGVTITSAMLSEPINRAVRDPTSGTFDCFNNYFAKPNNFNFEAGSPVSGSQQMAPYTYCEANINIYNTVSAGSLASDTDYIGFISLGYLQTYGHMIGLNIAYNIASPPSSYISYVTPATWGPYVAPSRPNVLYALSGIQGSGATGQYQAWRWLWEVTPNQIPSTGALLETGVWIAYMREPGTTSSGTSNFVNDQAYITLDPDDMAGGNVLNSNLGTYTPLSGQTQTIPDGKVNFNDVSYFVTAYIAYYSSHIYNPYADLTAQGTINFNDVSAFVTNYIAYYTTYNPPP